MKVNYELATVKKANSLVEASYKLSVNEQKLILMLTSSIRTEDKDFQTYVIAVKDLAKALKLKRCNIYDRVEELVSGLVQKTLTLERVVFVKNKPHDRTLKVNWLSSAEYFHGEGKVELCFDPKLKPYLLNLNKCFTTYKFREITQLKSNFSIRIYELLKQYENLESRQFELDELKGILGLSIDQYTPYYNFKVRILQVAQKELREKTSISFEFEEIKVGRKVGKIRFLIKKQQIPEIENISISDIRDIISKEEEPEIDKLLLMLPEQYREKASIRKLLEAYLQKDGYEYVSRNIAYTNDKSNAVNPGKSLNKKSNYRNYLKKALEKDFGLAFVEDMEEKSKSEQLKKEAEEKRQKESEKEKIAEEARERVEELIQNYLKNLTKDERKSLEQEAIERLEGDKKEAVLNKKTGSNIILKVEMKQVVKERILKD